MEAPDKIYATVQGSRLLGCSAYPYRYCDEYIRKDALLEWLEQVKADPMIPMNIDKVIEHINSL